MILGCQADNCVFKTFLSQVETGENHTSLIKEGVRQIAPEACSIVLMCLSLGFISEYWIISCQLPSALFTFFPLPPPLMFPNMVYIIRW